MIEISRNIYFFVFFSLILCLIIPGCITEISNPLINTSSVYQDTDYYSEAKELMASGNYDEALIVLDKAITVDSSNATPYILKSNIYFNKEKYNESINYAAIAMNLNPRESDSFLNTEISLLRLGLKNQGISYLGSIIDNQNNNSACEDTNIKIRINLCETDPVNSEFWKKWNRINLWERPGGGRYMGTTNACNDVDIFIIGYEKSGEQTYYKIREANRDLEGWI